MYNAYLDNGESMLVEQIHFENPSMEIIKNKSMGILLLVLWAGISAIGLLIAILWGNIILGGLFIAIPTLIGMILSPTFALCLFMFILPTGDAIAAGEILSVSKLIGLGLAFSFVLNCLVTKPNLRFNKIIFLSICYVIWTGLVGLTGPFLYYEMTGPVLRNVQLIALFIIVSWILENSSPDTLKWTLASLVAGMVISVGMAMAVGLSLANVDVGDDRISATLGGSLNSNHVAFMTGGAFLSAVYLILRYKGLLRLASIIAIPFIFFITLKSGSRSAILGIGLGLVFPFFSIKRLCKQPGVAIAMLLVLVFSGVGFKIFVDKSRYDSQAGSRLTDAQYAESNLEYRLHLIKNSINTARSYPLGTNELGWAVKNSTREKHFPHNAFFYNLGCYGFPGFGLSILIFILIWQVVRRMPEGHEKFFAISLMVFLFVTIMLHPYWLKKPTWIFFAVIVALGKLSELYDIKNQPENGNEGYFYEDTGDLASVST